MPPFQPRSIVEYHPHIQELVLAHEKRQADRQYHRDIEKMRDEAIKDIKIAPNFEKIHCYCEGCGREFTARAAKIVDSWSPIAYYRTKCRCGKWNIRRITDKLWDRYWFKSKEISKQRYENFADILQPFESGFNMLYKTKHE